MKFYEEYKQPIEETISVDSFDVHVSYLPNEALEELQNLIKAKKCLIPFEAIKDDLNWWGDDIYASHYASVASHVEEATFDESKKMCEDFARVLALLTDDEMISTIIADAPRKKDGHLMANRNVFACALDGLTRNAEYLRVNAKTGKDDTLTITVTWQRMVKYSQEPDAVPASIILQKSEYSPILDRMGLKETRS